MRAWNLRGNWRDESAAKKNKPTQRPPAWAVVGVDKGAHITVETMCAFTARAHNTRVYWGVLGRSRDFICSLLCASRPGPRLCAAGRVKGGMRAGQ